MVIADTRDQHPIEEEVAPLVAMSVLTTLLVPPVLRRLAEVPPPVPT